MLFRSTGEQISPKDLIVKETNIKRRRDENCASLFYAVLRLSGTCFIMVIMQKEGSSKLRIAMIGQKEVPSRFGGIEVAVEALAVRMAARGHQVTLYNCYRYNPRKRAGKGKLKFYKGVHICEVPVPDIKEIGRAHV